MTNQPFFSLILPIYKVEKYLDRCLNSIIKNKFDDYEIILVDDGSPDNCPIICDNWKKKNDKIKVIHKQNQGLGYARNTGIENAKGKYVWFIDSDDTIKIDSLNTIYNELKNKQFPDCIFFGVDWVKPNGKIIKRYSPKNETYNGKEIVFDLLPNFIFASPDSKIDPDYCKSAWCCCIKNDTLIEKNIRFISEKIYLSEDYYFWIQNFFKFKSIIFIGNELYEYHINEGSLSLSYRKDRLEKNIKLLYSLADIIHINSYPKECAIRIRGLFISNLIGCMKSEIKNKVGFFKKYSNFKNICNNKDVIETFKLYNCSNRGAGWKFISFSIKYKTYFALYFALSLKG